ncbi:unnamed protein product [Sphagnum balticum]
MSKFVKRYNSDDWRLVSPMYDSIMRQAKVCSQHLCIDEWQLDGCRTAMHALSAARAQRLVVAGCGATVLRRARTTTAPVYVRAQWTDGCCTHRSRIHRPHENARNGNWTRSNTDYIGAATTTQSLLCVVDG